MHPTTRREFLASAGAALAAGAALSIENSTRAAVAREANPVGANERISIGMIGVGGRGTALLNEFAGLKDSQQVEVTAVCDVWRQAREFASKRIQEVWGRAPRLTSRADELLAMKDIHAVAIATPDFSHAPLLARAARAGKDAYCEKPMATVLSEATEAYLAVKENSRVVQVGTQRRSDARFMAAAEIARSGILGNVSRVMFERNFNHPRWRRSQRDIAAVSGADVDWEQFLLGKKGVPFNSARFRQWQLDREFTSGIPGLWMSHFIDLIPWFLDDPFPRKVAAIGGVYVWKDGRFTSDTFNALLEYPKGFLVSYAMGLANSAGSRTAFYGTRGTLDCDRWILSGEGGGSDRIDPAQEVKPKPGASSRMQTDHVKNFLQCLRTREKPRADIAAGYSHAVATILSSVSVREGKHVGFNPETHEMTGA